jgi:hypothetical protein
MLPASNVKHQIPFFIWDLIKHCDQGRGFNGTINRAPEKMPWADGSGMPIPSGIHEPISTSSSLVPVYINKLRHLPK